MMPLPGNTPHSRRRAAALALALLCLAAGAAADAAVLELGGPAGAAVFLDGKALGFLPLAAPLELSPGSYRIRCELPGYRVYEQRVTLDSRRSVLRLQIRLDRPSRRTAWSSNLLFAGLGQHYLGKHTKGWVFTLAEAGGLVVAAAGEAQRSNYRKDYLLIKQQYDTALNAEEILYLRGLADQAYRDMEDMESLRDTGLLVAGGAVLLSILDAALFFPSLEAGSGALPLAPAGDEQARLSGPVADPTAVHFGVHLSF